MLIKETPLLAPFTTFGIGGPARWFVEATSEDEIARAAAWAEERGVPLFVLGGGSNLVIADGGWPGLVVRIAIGGISSPATNDAAGNAVLFSVGAGVDWDDFVAQAVAQNCAGVECALDLKEDRIVVLPKPACGFRYRASIFNTTERGRYIILRVNYRLKRGGAASLQYADLQKHFAERFPEPVAGKKTPPSLAEVREAVTQTILHVARMFPIIRFDAAMTLTKLHYQRLWFPGPERAVLNCHGSKPPPSATHPRLAPGGAGGSHRRPQ